VQAALSDLGSDDGSLTSGDMGGDGGGSATLLTPRARSERESNPLTEPSATGRAAGVTIPPAALLRVRVDAPPPLLPPLPPPVPMKAYPRKPAVPLTSNAAAPVPPVLPPHPPTRVALLCLTNPQHGKFGYGSDVHRDLVHLAKTYNPIFADQLLTDFSSADKRRRESLSVLDFALYLNTLAERYGFHPGKYAAANDALMKSTSIARINRELAGSTMPVPPPSAVPSEVPLQTNGSFVELQGFDLSIPHGFSPPSALMNASTRQEPLNASTTTRATPVGENTGTSFRRSPLSAQALAAMMRPTTPMVILAKDFAESAWLSLLGKRTCNEEITLRDFGTIVADPDSVMTPLFRLHFTWLDREVPALPTYDMQQRRRRVVNALENALADTGRPR
jgi:hypothetical protein